MNLVLTGLLIQSDSILFYFDICVAYDIDGQNDQHLFLVPLYTIKILEQITWGGHE